MKCMRKELEVEAMSKIGVSLQKAVESINKFVNAYEKARLAPKNKSR